MRSTLQQKQILELHQKNTITNDEWQERIDIKTNNQYLLEKIFTTDDAKWFTAKCKTCGDEMTKNVHYLRKSALYKKHTCSTCSKQKRLAEQNQIKAEKLKQKEEKLKQKEDKKIAHYFFTNYYVQPKKTKLKTLKHGTFTCKYCNAQFTSIYRFNPRTVCDNCKIEQNKESKRLTLILSRPHDDDITLHKLFVRDKGICYLCGTKCDYQDKYIDSKGTVITGNYYPSIDHVIALHDGGTHQWSNIKLAHRICNTLKH